MSNLNPDITLMDHQLVTRDFLARQQVAFDHSDPGTGKTFAAIAANEKRFLGKTLVLAPLSILKPSWAADIKTLTNKDAVVAHGSPKKRTEAMNANADYVVMNHDGVNWLADNTALLVNFQTIIVDEFTAFKNRNAKRTKALQLVSGYFQRKWFLSGTPAPNSVTDLWAPTFILDSGSRLGRSFYKFQSQVCTPSAVPGAPLGALKWTDKPDATLMVADMIKDISVRHLAKDCLDLPENRTSTYYIDLPTKTRKEYEAFKKDRVFVHFKDMVASQMSGARPKAAISSVNAAAMVRKLIQILTGSAYDGDGNVVKVHSERYNLVMDLVDQRSHSLVAFNYTHERDALIALAKSKSRNISHAYIDGSVSLAKRNQIVDDFQAGKYKMLLVHPQSTAHGLTLTKGEAVIWTTGVYSTEQYLQTNKRIDRKGQTKETETIRIIARDTVEEEVYAKLDGKLDRVEDLLGLLWANSQSKNPLKGKAA